jgi:hypothetical protein
MAASDWLGAAPAGEGRSLAVWAVARMAAALAEDVPFEAEIACAEGADRSTVKVSGSSAALRREEGGDPGVTALFDPASLIRDIGTVRARHGTRLGRPCVALEITPHPEWADPDSPWCQPDAQSVQLVVDAATGFLVEAETPWRDGLACHYQVTSLVTATQLPDGESPFGAQEWKAPDPAARDAAWPLARMAATLLEPVRASAQVTVHAEELGEPPTDPTAVPPPGDRSWSVTLATTGHAARTVTMGDDHDPQHTPFVIARLAEMLTPARIVSQLREVSLVPDAGGTTVSATVRPMRAFPLSAWAPDESAVCRFTVDPVTGVLTAAAVHIGDKELAHYSVTALHA